MSFWRSITVNCYQLILPRENAHRILQQLGRLFSLAFRNSSLQQQKPFAAQFKVIEEALLKLQFLQDKVENAEGTVLREKYSREQFHAFLEVADRKYRLQSRSSAHLLESAIEELSCLWQQYGRLGERLEELGREAEGLEEERTILKAGEVLFGSRLYSRPQVDQPQRQIRFKCGVICKQDEGIMRRTLFRMTKGLSIYSSIDCCDVWDEEKENQRGKVVFFLIFGYGESKVLSHKVQKLLDIYSIKSYRYPHSQEESKTARQKLQQKIDNNSKLAELVKNQMKNSLLPLLEVQYSENKIKFTKIEYYKLYLIQQKKIYEQLNQMKLHHNFYEAFVFIQAKNIEKVTTELHNRLIDDQMPSPQFIPIETADRPTLFQLNEVTATPYQILTAYGIPHYKEANPAMLNLTTFPFLFGVMFGDIAHGAILLAFALLLIYQRIHFRLLYPHRYTIALMGFFSFYCGLIYNQYLSLSLNLLGSCYQLTNGHAVQQEQCVYPLGLDPIWSIASNDLNFTNSLKMKIAVIIAICHMSVGLLVKGLNYWQMRKRMHILIDILPQLTFLWCVFGYMDFLIVYKWLHEWTGNTASSIITTMINIPLELGATTDCCGGQPMWGVVGDTSQDQIQICLLVAALVSVPAMFFLPLLYEALLRSAKRRREEKLSLNDELRMSEVNSRLEQQQLLGVSAEEAEIPIREMAVYQFIETIEFALGCISNTASYLRLWALSLAHCQLSDVFFSQTVSKGLQNGFLGILYNIALFPIFAGLTFGILLCMDTMECFLHTLRLHWVQFQSKFYKGDGIQFKSSDFYTSLSEEIAKKKGK